MTVRMIMIFRLGRNIQTIHTDQPSHHIHRAFKRIGKDGHRFGHIPGYDFCEKQYHRNGSDTNLYTEIVF